MKSSYLSLYVFVLVACSCSTPTNQEENPFGKSFNNERQKQGIPVIEEHWINRSKSDSIFDWINRSGIIETEEPHHFYKIVKVKNEKIVSERDGYNFITEIDSIRGFRLGITTYFDSTNSKVEQEYELIQYIKDSYPPTIVLDLTGEQSDSVLTSWNIK